jgi:hypothetical protein
MLVKTCLSKKKRAWIFSLNSASRRKESKKMSLVNQLKITIQFKRSIPKKVFKLPLRSRQTFQQESLKYDESINKSVQYRIVKNHYSCKSRWRNDSE